MTSAGYLEGDGLYIIAPDLSTLQILKRKEDLIKDSLLKKFSREFNVIFILREDYDHRHNKLYGYEDTEANQINEKEISDKLNGYIEFE